MSFLLTFLLSPSSFQYNFVWRPWLNSPGKADKRVPIILAFSEYSNTRVFTKFAFEQFRRKDRLLYWNNNYSIFLPGWLLIRTLSTTMLKFIYLCKVSMDIFLVPMSRAGHSRDKVCRPKKLVDYCTMATFVVATPFRHRVLNTFRIFACHCSSTTLSLSLS